MEKTKNVQWKYQNNSVVVPGYIKAELTQDDCLKAGSVFYVATIPEGSILTGMTAYSTCDMVETPSITVDIGVGNCELCTGTVLELTTSPNCVPACECTLTDKDYIVRVTLNDDIPTGCITMLFGVINPNFISGCAVEPIELDYVTTIVEPCTTTGCQDECPDTAAEENVAEKTNLVVQVTAGVPAEGV